MGDRGAYEDEEMPPLLAGTAASLGGGPPAKLNEGAVVLWVPDPEQVAGDNPMIDGLTHGYREYYISRRPQPRAKAWPFTKA